MGKNKQSAAGAASTPPTPDGLSAYTFVNAYDARTLPLKLALLVCVIVFVHITAMFLYFQIALEKYDGDPDRLRWFMVRHFDLDTETSFGTYYSAIALLFVGRLLWHHAKRVKRAGEIWHVWWFILAIGFHWLSIDEVIAGHEVLNEYKSELPGERERWTYEGLYVAGLIGAAFLPFLWHIRWRLALFAIVGGAVYLGGALSVEQATDKYQDWGLLGTTEYLMWVALEEGMEMMGPVIFLAGLLPYLASRKATQ
ncbi:MAG: hypothetical protein O2894_05680 [Planctomycetota bacterium]|nr:hypothetical protein [Planctomycetota bacterium]